MFLHQNGITYSLYIDLLPTNHGSLSLQEDEGKQGNMQRQYLQDNSSQTNPTRSSALPADVDEQAITSPKTAEKDVHSHTALKHVPESNATSKQQWINLQKFSTPISCLANLCNRDVSGSQRQSRMPTSHRH